MGCGSSTVIQPKTDAATQQFDKILEAEAAEAQLHFKLLTLGAGESGKSTIIKQLVFLHKQSHTSEEEKLAYVRVLHGNVLNCISTLIHETNDYYALTQDDRYLFTEHDHELVESIENFDSRNLLTYEIAECITELWEGSHAIQHTFDRRGEFWLLEGCLYYLTNMHRFISPDFSPSEEDIVMARKRTTGVVETSIKYGGVNWTVVDVGGQRSERRKWLNCFEGVAGILYVVNLAGYCSVLFEDRQVNRMQESLKLFEETMSQSVFATTPVFLILNKKDLFESLIRTKPLTIAFPEYTGPQELRPCIEYIASQFASKLKPNRPRPMILLMAARVKKDVQWCFEDCKDTLIDMNRKGIKKAQAKLDALREQYRNEQLQEMEKNIQDAKERDERLARQAKIEADALAAATAGVVDQRLGGGLQELDTHDGNDQVGHDGSLRGSGNGIGETTGGVLSYLLPSPKVGSKYTTTGTSSPVPVSAVHGTMEDDQEGMIEGEAYANQDLHQ